jgi:CxxC motif-containing protein (DUF1111 family)
VPPRDEFLRAKMSNSERGPLDDFGASAADTIVRLCAGAAGIDPSARKWAVRILWTLGQTPAIAGQAQYDLYARRVLTLLEQNIGKRTDKAAFKDLIYGIDGAEAIALTARMAEWRKRAGN